MIITDTREASRSTVNGESAEFRIASNAKAFRILIDGIYADKIGSIVRELLSNAWDAHVRIGNIATPFEVRLPNPLNPTFSVRDFGCSMDHEFVMTTYSTLFESSKTESNDEVGAFGLGAKAFFAYTDACTLTCWLDGEKRTYAIRLNGRNVPEVMLVHRAPSSEPQGVEVMFAVEASDFPSFRVAAQRCAYGTDVLPKFLGNEVVTVDPDFRGDGWRFWRNTPISDRQSVVVRQGCAVYPTNVGGWHVPHSALMIVDVPIGAANVTASRESLALTNEQREGLDRYVEKAMKALAEKVLEQYHALPTEVQRAHFAVANKALLDGHGLPVSVTLPVSLRKWDAGAVTPYSNFAAATLSRMVIVHDDGKPILRRQLRLRALAKMKSVYIETDLAVIRTAVAALELSPSQVLPIDRIPDVTVNRTRSTTIGGAPKQPKEKVESDRPWAYCNRNQCRAGEFTWHMTKGGDLISGNVGKWLREVVTANGKPVLYLTDKEAKTALAKGKITEAMRLDQFALRAVNNPSILQVAETYLTEREITRSCVYSARALMLEKAMPNCHRTPNGSLTAELVEYFLKPQHRAIMQRIATIVHDLRNRYPLCFNVADESTMTAYISLCDSAQITSKVA